MWHASECWCCQGIANSLSAFPCEVVETRRRLDPACLVNLKRKNVKKKKKTRQTISFSANVIVLSLRQTAGCLFSRQCGVGNRGDAETEREGGREREGEGKEKAAAMGARRKRISITVFPHTRPTDRPTNPSAVRFDSHAHDHRPTRPRPFQFAFFFFVFLSSFFLSSSSSSLPHSPSFLPALPFITTTTANCPSPSHCALTPPSIR